MDENPYASPEFSEPVLGVLSGERRDLRKVAQAQKVIIGCIAINLLLFALQSMVPDKVVFVLGIPVLGIPVLGIPVLACVVVGAVYVFVLAIRVYGVGLGILLGVMALIPYLGLIVLLVVNGEATKVLKQNGIPVGLLGAKTSSL
jgi:hypothetical protein